MKYQKKVSLAEEGVKLLVDGLSLDEYETQLINEGYANYEIDQVKISVNNIILQKYEKVFSKHLLDGDLEENRSKFPLLNNKMYERLKKNEIDKIRSRAKRDIELKLNKGISHEEILESTTSTYFSQDEVNNHMATYLYKNEIITDDNKMSYIYGGIFFILLGVVASVLFPNRLFYGAIIVGCISLFKGIFKIED